MTAEFLSCPLKSVELPAKRLAQRVESYSADAWIIHLGNTQLLQWFSDQSIPFLAWGAVGFTGVANILATSLSSTLRKVVGHLAASGHQRIVWLCPEHYRPPLAPAYVDILKRVGIHSSPFHLPEWEESPAGLNHVLTSLFQITPPTALILNRPSHMIGTLAFLAKHRIRVPEDVSLFSLWDDPIFSWHHPGLRIAHVRLQDEFYVKSLLSWTRNLMRGIDRKERHIVPVNMVPGNSLGRPGKPPVIRDSPGGGIPPRGPKLGLSSD